MTAIFSKPGIVTVSYNARRNYVLFDWTSFAVTLDEIRTLHAAALAAAQKHNCRTYVAETAKVTNTLRQDVIEWWGTVWVPRLAEAGLRAIITVQPTSAIASLSTRSWQRTVVEGITMINVGSLPDAEAALASLAAETPAR
jgi:hypothetical protein